MDESNLTQYDDQGFEVPSEYPLSSEKDCLMCLSLSEYNRFINKKGAAAEIYRLDCIRKHLLDKSMTHKSESRGSLYNPETNSIEAKPGYSFNPKTCTFEKEAP